MKTKTLLFGAILPLLAASTAGAAVAIPAGGVTVDFATAPSGADFASVSVTGGAGDLTVIGTGTNGIDNPTTGISATLAWPAAATDWTAAANSIATEPTTAQALNAQMRYAVNTGRILTGTTGNRYQALIGLFQNNTGGDLSSIDLQWTVGTPFDSAGTGAFGTDPLAGIHVYFSKTGATGSWTRFNGPFGPPDGPVARASISIPGNLANNGDLYIAWIDDNGPASNTSPNFEGHYTVDDVVLSMTSTASITPIVTNIVRDDNLTPLDPSDDKINFTLTVNGAGAVGPGWVVTTPAAFANTGTYGNPVNYVGVPISEFAAPGHTVTVTVDDVTFAASNTFSVTAPWCAITPGAATGFVYNDGTTPADATDDTVSLLATATGIYTGPSFTVTGAGAPQSAPYGSSATLTTTADPAGPPSTPTLTFTDSADAACTATLAVGLPGIIGTNNLSGTPGNIISQGFSGTRPWVINSLARESRQTNATQADHVILSEPIDLTSVGAVQISATLDAITGASSGFEAPDHFQLEIIVDGGAPVSILGDDDVDGDGLLEGAANGAVPADPGVELPDVGDINLTRTYDFSSLIPASANSLQIRIVGNSNSGNETLLLKNLMLSLPTVTSDTDGDGVSNADEQIMGTSPTDANDVMRLSQNPGNPNQISFPTVNGRFYRVYMSDDAAEATHLQIWKDAGLGTFPGNGNPATFTITVAPGESRRFYRVHVMQTDGPNNDGVWPATWP